jgi:hypothetical protein
MDCKRVEMKRRGVGSDGKLQTWSRDIGIGLRERITSQGMHDLDELIASDGATITLVYNAPNMKKRSEMRILEAQPRSSSSN